MFERNERDFSIYKEDKKPLFTINIGTWTNFNQTLIDVMFYLSLNDEERKDNFLDELKQYNDLFIDNKEDIIKDFKESGFNLINSIINEYDINDFINEFEYEDKQEKNIKEDEYYYFDFEKCDKDLEKNFIKEIEDIVLKSNDIVELYNNLQKLKVEINEEVYNTLYDYVYIERD